MISSVLIGVLPTDIRLCDPIARAVSDERTGMGTRLRRWVDRMIQALPRAYADSASLHAVGVDLTPLAGHLPRGGDAP